MELSVSCERRSMTGQRPEEKDERRSDNDADDEHPEQVGKGHHQRLCLDGLFYHTQRGFLAAERARLRIDIGLHVEAIGAEAFLHATAVQPYALVLNNGDPGERQ